MNEQKPQLTDHGFEQESLALFEKKLKGFNRASQYPKWEKKTDVLLDKLTFLPTAPFPKKLMELFDYRYLILSESIAGIIQKSLEIREQMEHTRRFVGINEQYYNLPFLPKGTFVKRIEVYNHNNELCYLVKGRLKIRADKLRAWLDPSEKGCRFRDIFASDRKVMRYKKLKIYHYSPIIDLSSTDHMDYYAFFADYHSRLRLARYFEAKEKITVPAPKFRFSNQALEEVLKLSKPQQVLWGYFLFRLMGMKLRVNVEVAMLTRFLHIINKVGLEGYKNSYYYKLVSKAPYVTEDRTLLRDLETVMGHFKKSDLPVEDIEKELSVLSSQ